MCEGRTVLRFRDVASRLDRPQDLQPTAFVFEIVLLALSRAIESAFHDEGRDRVEFSAIQECSMSSADIDDRSGQPAEIHTIHHLAADDAGAVTHARL